MRKIGNFKWDKGGNVTFEEDKNGSVVVEELSEKTLHTKTYKIGIDPVDDFFESGSYAFGNEYKAFCSSHESITRLKHRSKLNVIKYRRK